MVLLVVAVGARPSAGEGWQGRLRCVGKVATLTSWARGNPELASPSVGLAILASGARHRQPQVDYVAVVPRRTCPQPPHGARQMYRLGARVLGRTWQLEALTSVSLLM